MAQTPTAKYRKDYQTPSHSISEIDLTFDLYDQATTVTAISTVKQLGEQNALVLDGESIELKSLKVNGTDWANYTLLDSKLEIKDLPEQFELSIETLVNPEANTALEGLYKSGGAFCTQCEAEGFRRITYYLDRPDVLAKYTTKVIADKQQYPYLLSNGNRVAEGDLKMVVIGFNGKIRILNQRTCLHWWQVILMSYAINTKHNLDET